MKGTQSGSSYKVINQTLDVTKFIMAILVVIIHTEPFVQNIWLDRGLGILTRLCVPFFFVTSGYLFFSKKKSLKRYCIRLLVLYVIWAVVYLPFDIHRFSKSGMGEVLCQYLIRQNDVHYLWYIFASIIAMIIVYYLSKWLGFRKTMYLSVIFLCIGCFLSSWSPLLTGGGYYRPAFGDAAYRNGLFYGFPYVSMGAYLAQRKTSGKVGKLTGEFLGCLFGIAVESSIFVLFFHTWSTILWISVFPASYFFFKICLEIEDRRRWVLKNETSKLLRELSTLIYVSHNIFMICYGKMEHGPLFFAEVLISTLIFSLLIWLISRKVTAFKYFM